ncbi:MAG TPA: isocitrate lyase/PEP mutase family protein [Negativicutes bacterium]|jgi:2-methylisocitrate lyase-like PEP mutase family enzyme
MLKNPGKVLRELLAEPGILTTPGAYDGISARLIEQAGFRAAYMSGAGVSASVTGQADIGLITMTEMVTAARNLSSAINIPIIADADTGYGNPMNVIRTIHEYELAGVAAVQFEDQVAPKRCGHLSGKEVVPTADFVSKLKAAVNEKYDKDLVIVARTDARAIEGFDQAIERCKRYIETGVDVIFFEAPQSVDEVEKVARILGSSVALLSNQVPGGKTPALTAKELEQMGYKIVIFPSVLNNSAMIQMQNTLEILKEKGMDSGIIKGGNAMNFFTVMGIDEWLAKGKKYTTL